MKPHVINALGVLDNPNLQLQPDAGDRQAMAYTSSGQNVDARSLADAREAGLTAVNITLGHVAGSAVGDGATVADDRGLSSFWLAVVERLLVDLSHSSEKTCLDALRAARRLLAITHSGCRAVADQGVVVGLYFMPYLRLEGQPMAADLIAHLEHAIQVCGEDHVGLGTDGGNSTIDDMAAYRAMLATEHEGARVRAAALPQPVFTVRGVG